MLGEKKGDVSKLEVAGARLQLTTAAGQPRARAHSLAGGAHSSTGSPAKCMASQAPCHLIWRRRRLSRDASRRVGDADHVLETTLTTHPPKKPTRGLL